MEYLPFGETLTDEHLNSTNSPFKFNGKERNEETGNYYYGARYYDPKLSISISVFYSLNGQKAARPKYLMRDFLYNYFNVSVVSKNQ